MRKRNPIEKSHYINDRYKEYLRSSFQFGNKHLRNLFETQLERETLFKGPYVDLNLPFQRGKSIQELMEEGVICRSFAELNDINLMRPLYAHQEEAIRLIGRGRSAVITTGTGSGKTESFLYPILNELLSDVEQGNRDVGIRAIFLYPMNALVNDQIDRVRQILVNCPDIIYGFFTGETKETVPKNYREKLGRENETIIPENELVSRKEIRENPPHLLFTNYSMLEYLLIRPNDCTLFSKEYLGSWKYVVLDEAHSYHGSLGIELSMLMRRVTGLSEKKPRFILTSATLGEKGKSEQEIVDFAENLTSARFEQSDIIFSKRIPLSHEKIRYRVKGEDYTALRCAEGQTETVTGICRKYNIEPQKDMRASLYELLTGDQNVYDLYTILKNGCRPFHEIWNQMNGSLSDTELIALIDLVNLAEKDGIGIFDLKYHSFVRPLAGAYATLEKEPKLSLTKTNYIGELKAFEIGNCRYCSVPYIIGKIQYNDEDGLDHLFQNDEIDIYENYGNNKFVKLDYFLLDNSISEDVEKSELEKCMVCAKCGSIHAAENLNAKKCTCGEVFQFPVYRVVQKKKENEEGAFNNIHQCPCCGHKGTKGIVKSLNLGKDEGTALIAQILYEAIDEGKEQPQKLKKLSLKSKTNGLMQKQETKAKQFLCFSDSRQQASFSAVFLNATHIRMLQKRLIWEVIVNQNFRDIPVDELAAYLTEIIKSKDLFSNDLSAHKNAWAALMTDLLRVDGSYDGEGLGLYYFDLDLSAIDKELTEQDVEEVLGRYDITKKDLLTMMQVVLDVFKTTPAINYVKSTLTPEEKKEYLEYRRFDNYVIFRSQKTGRDIRSFCSMKGGGNRTSRYIQKVCGCGEEDAFEIMDIIFNSLLIGASELEGEESLVSKHDRKEAYQINADRYILKNYKTSEFYRCSKCGRLTPYNVHDKCVQDGCDGTLYKVEPDEVLKYNYYRNQYKNKKIERIVIKEHTAQLDRKTAKQYQKDFKNKKINILSCSTTFEMGIDIGNLETVFMRNIPPSPANYVQRAGRAGRRKDSSAYILTYCGTSSHDFTYFTEPEKMISGVIRPPYFNVLNKKIIVRHLMAACLGSFFRTYPYYFSGIQKLVFEGGADAFSEYISGHPEALNRYINEKVIPENRYAEYHNFKWFDEMGGKDAKLQNFIESIQKLEDEFEEGKKYAVQTENYQDAEYYIKQIENLHKGSVIESLSQYCVIPKYGFPVDVVDLDIFEEGKRNNRYDLSRDLKIAISEYAPDSEVIADGKKYTSKYISLPRKSPFPRYYFCTCENCRKVNVFVSSEKPDICKYCGEPIDKTFVEYFIEPVYGFKTGVTKESPHMKPKRSYSGEVSYLGGGIKDELHMEIGNIVIAESSTDDELLVINRSRFYMCPKCGYSEIVKGKDILPTTEKEHKNYRQYDCSCKELQQLRLGHRFKTDVVRFTIPLLGLAEKTSYSKALSFLYGLLEGVSIGLGIERNDIDGILEMNPECESYDVLLYDNVPGGAGHVKRLMNADAFTDVLKETLNKVSGHCCEENTSCYGCLRNYYNQAYHSRLRRGYAKEVTQDLLNLISEGIK